MQQAGPGHLLSNRQTDNLRLQSYENFKNLQNSDNIESK